MIYNLKVTDHDVLSEDDASSDDMSSQSLSIIDDCSEYEQGLDQEDLWIESQEDLRNAAAADNSPVKRLSMETAIEEERSCQNLVNSHSGDEVSHDTGAGAGEGMGCDQEDSGCAELRGEVVMPVGNLVARLPLMGIAVKEENFDVADTKLVKATELEEIDIDWWIQQNRCKVKKRRHKNWRRRSRKRELIFIPFQSRKARNRAESCSKC